MLGLAPFFFAKQKTLKRKMLNIFLCKKRFGALRCKNIFLQRNAPGKCTQKEIFACKI